MDSQKAYVRLDEHGVMRVGDTKVMLDSVVAAFHLGHSPETIQQQYPSLNLRDVYGAVAYYLDNRPEIDRYLRRQSDIWDEARRQTAERANPVVQRLRSRAADAGTRFA